MEEISGIVEGEPTGMFRAGYPGPNEQTMKQIGDWGKQRNNYHTWLTDPITHKIYDPTPMPSDPFNERMDYHVSKVDKTRKFYREFPEEIASFHREHIHSRIVNEVMIPNAKNNQTFSQFLDEMYGKYLRGACYTNCLVYKKKFPHLIIVFGAMGYWCRDEHEGKVCLKWGC
jgi:hypothetical protein